MTLPLLVCTSVAPPDAEACRAALAGSAGAEIRLDAMAASAAEVRTLFGELPTAIATCRAGRHDEATRRALLLAAIEGGAAYVDVELCAPPALRAEVSRAARAAHCRVIVSHHDGTTTPAAAELRAIRERCFDEGADLAKIACWVTAPVEAARLLGLLDDERPNIVVGMGPLGRPVRVAAALLGSPIAYVRAGPGQETAAGQLDRTELERLLREWAHG